MAYDALVLNHQFKEFNMEHHGTLLFAVISNRAIFRFHDQHPKQECEHGSTRGLKNTLEAYRMGPPR